MIHKKELVIFALSFLIVFIIAGFGSLFTGSETKGDWYLQNKPAFTPPNYVFPIAWTILYVMIAISMALALLNRKNKQKKKIAILYGINLFSNGLWSYLFFALKSPALAFIDLLIILTTAILLIIALRKIDKRAMWLLVPYLLWLIFAGVLNLAFLV